jgi:hypothetical protein
MTSALNHVAINRSEFHASADTSQWEKKQDTQQELIDDDENQESH